MEEKIINRREKSVGARYELTQELKSHLKLMRKEINFSAETMASELGLNLNTYNNIEKVKGSTSITSQVLDKFFKVYKDNIGWGSMSQGEFVIMHLDKCLYSPNQTLKNIDNQDWIKAYYLKYKTVILGETLLRRIERDFYNFRDAVELLNKNKHIKTKTRIIYPNEVYISLEKEKYPDLGGYPYWCIKYDLSDNDIDEIVLNVENKQEIRYSTLFSILVSIEVVIKGRRDFDNIYSDIYFELSQYDNIFNKTKKLQQDYDKGNLQNAFVQPDRPTDSTSFYEMLKDYEKGNVPPHIIQLVKNCIQGKDNFINAIDLDFSPLYNANSYEIESFKLAVKEMLNSFSK